MARQRVPVKPMQKALGEDYDEETLGKLAYLQQMQGNDQLDVSGTAQPMVQPPQEFQDVPRQPAETEEPGWLERFAKYAANEQPPQEMDTEQALGLLGDGMQEGVGQVQLEDTIAEESPEDAIAALGDQEQQPEMIQEQVVEEEVPESAPQDQMVNEIVQAFQSNPEVMNLLPPEVRKMFKEGDPVKMGLKMEEIAEMLRPQMGAIEAALKDDRIMNSLRIFDGLTDSHDNETLADSIALQNILAGKEDLRSERELQLKESLESGSLTDQEIVALGIATVVPALLSLFFGKEAALGAIAGGLKGAAEFIGNKQPDKGAVRKGLMDIQEERQKDLAFEVDLKDKISKTISSPKLRKFLTDRKVEVFKEDGKVGVEVDPEFGMYLDVNKMKSDREFEKWDKDDKKDREAVGVQMEVNESLEQVIDLMEEVKKQNPSLLTTIWNNYSGQIPKTIRDATPEQLKIMKIDPIKVLVNGEVREVNPFRQIEQIMNRLQISYIAMNDMDNRLTNIVKDHLSGVLSNPADTLQWWSHDIDDFIEKANTLRNGANKKFVNKAEINGYVGAPLKAMFPYGDYKVVNQDSIQKGFQSALAEPEKNESKVVR